MSKKYKKVILLDVDIKEKKYYVVNEVSNVDSMLDVFNKEGLEERFKMFCEFLGNFGRYGKLNMEEVIRLYNGNSKGWYYKDKEVDGKVDVGVGGDLYGIKVDDFDIRKYFNEIGKGSGWKVEY